MMEEQQQSLDTPSATEPTAIRATSAPSMGVSPMSMTASAPSMSVSSEPTASTQGSLALALAPLPSADDELDAPPARRRGRRRRRSRARARTISIRRLSKTELNRGRMLYPETDYWKPRSRADCVRLSMASAARDGSSEDNGSSTSHSDASDISARASPTR